MSQENSSPTVPAAPRAWSKVWWIALTRPSATTYETLVNDARATSKVAYAWLVRTAIVAEVILTLIQVLTQERVEPDPASFYATIGLFNTLAALFSILAFAIVTGVTQLIAKALGGTGTYSKLAFATTAYSAPLLFVTLLAIAIPSGFGSCLIIPLGIYGLILNVIAVKAVNQLGWGKAIIPSVVIIVASITLYVLLALIILIMS